MPPPPNYKVPSSCPADHRQKQTKKHQKNLSETQLYDLPIGLRCSVASPPMGRRWAADGPPMGRRWDADGPPMGRRWDADGIPGCSGIDLRRGPDGLGRVVVRFGRPRTAVVGCGRLWTLHIRPTHSVTSFAVQRVSSPPSRGRGRVRQATWRRSTTPGDGDGRE